MEPSPAILKKEFMQPYENLKTTTEKEISDLQWKKAAAVTSGVAVGIFAVLSSALIITTAFLIAWGSISLILFTPYLIATAYSACSTLITSSLIVAGVASWFFFNLIAATTHRMGGVIIELFKINVLFEFARNKNSSEFYDLESQIQEKKNQLIEAYDDAKNRWNAEKTERQTLCSLARQNVIDYTTDYNGIIPSDAPLWDYLPPDLRKEISDLVLVQ